MVEQCEGSYFSSGSQWLNLVRDEVILRAVNDPDNRLWTASNCDSEVGIEPNHVELAYSIFDLMMAL